MAYLLINFCTSTVPSPYTSTRTSLYTSLCTSMPTSLLPKFRTSTQTSRSPQNRLVRPNAPTSTEPKALCTIKGLL